MANEQDYVDLGLSCADVCEALEEMMEGKTMGNLGKLERNAINELTAWVEPATRVFCSSTYHRLDYRIVEEIQERVLKRSGRGKISRIIRSRDDKGPIVAWKTDLIWILHVFNVCSTCPSFVVANLQLQHLHRLARLRDDYLHRRAPSSDAASWLRQSFILRRTSPQSV